MFCRYVEQIGDPSLMISLGKYLDFAHDDVITICCFLGNDWMFLGDCKEMESPDNRNYTFRHLGVPPSWSDYNTTIPNLHLLTQKQFNWMKDTNKYSGHLTYDLYVKMRTADNQPLEKLSSAKRPKK